MRVPPIIVLPKIKKLYEGEKIASGQLSLNDSVTNYDIIIIKLKTNVEYIFKTVVEPFAGQQLIFSTATANSQGLVNEPFYYKNVLNVTIPSDATKLNLGEAYNNANLIIGIVAVYGIKLVESIS